jgi:tetratricopeptide (TPR) repeat protein
VISLVGLPGVGKTHAALAWAAAHPGAALLQGAHPGDDASWRDALARARRASHVVCDDADALPEARAEELRLAILSSPETSWLLTSRARSSWPGASTVTLGLLTPERSSSALLSMLRARGASASEDQLAALAAPSRGYAPDLEACAARVEVLGARAVLDGPAPSTSHLDTMLAEVWGALDEHAREVWAIASLFATPCAARHLVARAPDPERALDAIAALCARGVLTRAEGDPPRFALHDALADFARATLDAPARRVDAHVRWILDGAEVPGAEVAAQLERALATGVAPELCVALGALTLERARASTSALARCDALGAQALAAPGLARVRLALAHRVLDAGDTARARALLDAATRDDLAPEDAARAFALRASIARVAAASDRAVASYERALEQLDDADPLARLRVLIERAGARWERGDHDEAIAEMITALEASRAHGARAFEGVVLSNYGVMLHHQGRLEEAAAHHELALAIHEELGRTRFIGIAWFDLSALAHERGAAALALDHAARAAAALAEAGDARHLALVDASRGALRARTGLPPDVDFDAITRRLELAEDVVFAEAVSLYARLARAYAGLEDASGFDDAPYLRRPDEVRLPARLLAETGRALDQDDALLVSHDDTAFLRSRAGGVVDLTRRAAYQAIFSMLVERRLRGRPPASLDALFQAGWPDEAITPDALRNRVHVALSSLRRMGLRGVLHSHDAGYLLSEDVPLIRRAGPTLARATSR